MSGYKGLCPILLWL